MCGRLVVAHIRIFPSCQMLLVLNDLLLLQIFGAFFAAGCVYELIYVKTGSCKRESDIAHLD